MYDFSRIDLEKHPESRHLPLVMLIAKEYLAKFDGGGLEIGDYLSIGWIALKRCYQAGYDGRSTTYLARVIRNFFREAIDGLRLIHVPKSTLREARRDERDLPSLRSARFVLRMQRRALTEAVSAARLKLDRRWIDLEALREGLLRIPTVEAECLRLVYGLDRDQLSQTEIGERGLISGGQPRTKQKVNQIKREGLKRLAACLSGPT